MDRHSVALGTKIGVFALLTVLAVAVVLAAAPQLRAMLPTPVQSTPAQSSSAAATVTTTSAARPTVGTILADPAKIVQAMFPRQTWRRQGRFYTGADGSQCLIESLVPGSFTRAGRDEILVVVQPVGSISHAAGFYQRSFAIFDNTTGQMAAPVFAFSADEGDWQIFDEPDRSSIFVAGQTTYQGWTTWQGGLWQAGPAWQRVWPVLSPGQKIDDWWQDRAARVKPDGIDILNRKLLPRTRPDQLIPDFIWEPGDRFVWNPETGIFEKP